MRLVIRFLEHLIMPGLLIEDISSMFGSRSQFCQLRSATYDLD